MVTTLTQQSNLNFDRFNKKKNVNAKSHRIPVFLRCHTIEIGENL